MTFLAQENESLRSAVTKLSAYWVGLTQRERILVIGLALIALALAPMSAWELAQRGRETTEQSRLELVDQTLRQHSVSRATLLEAQNTVAQTRGWGWKAKSPSVGLVLVEQQINSLAMRAGLTSIDIATNKRLTQLGALKFVRLQVNADFDWITLTQFLSLLGKTDKAIMVRSVSVTGDMPAKVQLVIDAALSLEAPE
jgi:hypothetical protein